MRKLLGLFAIFFFPVVQAEESDDANIMEEIVVTATTYGFVKIHTAF